MELIINNKTIDTPIRTILTTLKRELGNGLLKDINRETLDNIPITCPVHKDGKEHRPSCFVYCRKDNNEIEYGKVHCFTCGYTATLPAFVADCFGRSESFGEQWLLQHFGSTRSILTDIDNLEPIVFETPKKEYLDESVLNNYMYYHPYMWKRGLSKEVIDRFGVGYDKHNNCLTFPIWDEHNNLVMITSRNVSTKFFHIDADKDKPVYLLNFINNDNIDKVYVCESQINALTMWTWGYPSIALIGTGSSYQYEILNKCGIRNYVLCFDGDAAGDKGRERFIKNIRKDVFVSYKKIPFGKDVNDLTKEQFDSLDEFFLWK